MAAAGVGVRDRSLRAVAIMKADGLTHPEIAAHSQCPLSAVEHRVPSDETDPGAA